MITMSNLCNYERQKVAITFKWHYSFRDVIKTIYSTYKIMVDKHILSNRFFKLNGKIFDINNVIDITSIDD